jgi:hypothetical protein
MSAGEYAVDPRVKAVVEHLRSLLPPLPEDVANDEPGYMGPTIEVPAVFLQIALMEVEHAWSTIKYEQLLPDAIKRLGRRAREQTPGVSVCDMPGDAEPEFQGELGATALMFAVQPTNAIAMLVAAAGAIAIGRLGRASAFNAFENAAIYTRAQMLNFYEGCAVAGQSGRPN